MSVLTKISFPGIGIGEINLSSTAFSIGNVSIAWYALIITLGMILAVAYVMYRAKSIGIKFDDVIDFAIFVIPIGILGARLYYVLMKLEDFHSIGEVFNIRSGGLAIYGGIIAGTLTVIAVCYFKKISFPAFGDCIVPGLILAQSVGRWGNFVNVEAYGSPTRNALRMCGTSIANELLGKNLINSEQYSEIIAGTLGVHPTFFYESMWNLLGFVLINIFYKKKKYDGQFILIIFAWYGLGRLWIEGLRTDSLYLFGSGIRVSQLLAGILFVACTGLLIYFAVKRPRKEMFFYIKQNKKKDK